jgi:DNA polymerase delta subunit 2
VQVVVAGNSVSIKEDENEAYSHFAKDRAQNDRRKNETIGNALNDFDIFLTSLVSSVSVLLMPGASDPSTFALPQQPFPKFLVRNSSQYSNLNNTTNPCKASVGGIRVLGTSGQNVDDLRRYSTAKEQVEYLERCLRWRHIAPTAPDTLCCYAFPDADPFVLEECPHVYFAGNQDSFSSKLVKGLDGQQCRVIMVPSFSRSGSIVLVNLQSLECREVKFSLSSKA